MNLTAYQAGQTIIESLVVTAIALAAVFALLIHDRRRGSQPPSRSADDQRNGTA